MAFEVNDSDGEDIESGEEEDIVATQNEVMQKN